MGTDREPRRRRWWIAGAVITALLIAWAVAVHWAAQRLGEDVQRTFRGDPASDSAHRRD